MFEECFKMVDAFDERGCLDHWFWAHLTDADESAESFRSLCALEDVAAVICSYGGLCTAEPREFLRRQLAWL